MTNELQSVIDGLKKEEERLGKIAARFKKSHSVHHDTVRKIINSIEEHLRMLESGRANAA
jgi:hypothetical protein